MKIGDNVLRLMNAKGFGQVFYGLHMAEGVAEYREEGKEPFRVLINEAVAKKMDKTFPGKPVFVRHVEKIEFDSLQSDADGWVVESFFNRADGRHWSKFIIVSDEGLAAIKRGWKLSNAYMPELVNKIGQWHGVDYDQEVIGGEYEHLAIVPNPRYEESVVMTPEQFKAYNHSKEQELVRLANSKDKGEKPMKFNLFKRTKVENDKANEIEGMVVKLEKSGKEVELTTLINEADEREMSKDKPALVNGKDTVKVGEETVSVDELVESHIALQEELEALKVTNAKKKKNKEDEQEEKDDKKENGDDEDMMENEDDEVMENEDDEDEEADKKKAKMNKKKKNAADKSKGKEHFEKLRNAHETAEDEVAVVDLSDAQVSRGKERYG